VEKCGKRVLVAILIGTIWYHLVAQQEAQGCALWTRGLGYYWCLQGNAMRAPCQWRRVASYNLSVMHGVGFPGVEKSFERLVQQTDDL
jgi:hypothetical protein